MQLASRGRVRPPRGRTGAAAVELALVLPVMVTIILGCIDFGRFAYTYAAVAASARAGAAYGVNHPFDSSSQAAWQAGIRKAATEEMMYQVGYDPNLLVVQASSTVDNVSQKTGGGERRVEVVTTYSIKTFVPWPGIPATVVMKGAVDMRSVR
jgi:Flp pilus assembly protein TadG